MKSKLIVTLAVTMLLACSMTAFAAGSSTSSSAASSATSSSSSSNVTPSYADTSKDTTEQKAITNAAAAAISGATTDNGTKITSRAVSASEYTTLLTTATQAYPTCQVLAVADINGILKSGGENITLSVAGVSATDNVLLLHHGKGGIEILKPTAVGNGTVTAFFTSLSPVEVIKIVAVPATTDATAETTSATVEKAPKTGDDVYIVYLAMGLAIVGAAVCFKKLASK